MELSFEVILWNANPSRVAWAEIILRRAILELLNISPLMVIMLPRDTLMREDRSRLEILSTSVLIIVSVVEVKIKIFPEIELISLIFTF